MGTEYVLARVRLFVTPSLDILLPTPFLGQKAPLGQLFSITLVGFQVNLAFGKDVLGCPYFHCYDYSYKYMAWSSLRLLRHAIIVLYEKACRLLV